MKSEETNSIQKQMKTENLKMEINKMENNRKLIEQANFLNFYFLYTY